MYGRTCASFFWEMINDWRQGVRLPLHLTAQRYFSGALRSCLQDPIDRVRKRPNALVGRMCFDLSNVEFDGVRIACYDKVHRTSGMRHIDCGLEAFHRCVFASIPTGEKRDLATVSQYLLQAGNLAANEVRERFYEIGSSEGLRETSEFLASQRGSNQGGAKLD